MIAAYVNAKKRPTSEAEAREVGRFDVDRAAGVRPADEHGGDQSMPAVESTGGTFATTCVLTKAARAVPTNAMMTACCSASRWNPNPTASARIAWAKPSIAATCPSRRTQIAMATPATAAAAALRTACWSADRLSQNAQISLSPVANRLSQSAGSRPNNFMMISLQRDWPPQGRKFVGPGRYRPRMGYQRIDLDGQASVSGLRMFGRGDPQAITYRRVAMGAVGGRWFVQKSGRSGTTTWLAPDERAACETLDRWMRAGGWQEITEQACGIRN